MTAHSARPNRQGAVDRDDEPPTFDPRLPVDERSEGAAAPSQAEMEQSSEQAGAQDSAVSFDPAEHTVPEVMEYLEANPDQADAVRAAERDGKGRVTIINSD